MSDIIVGIKYLEHYDKTFPLPQYQTELSAGMDIRASFSNKEKLVISPFQRVLVPTGISLEIPAGFEIQVRPRSGLSFKTNLFIPNSPGTIDADYRGEIMVIMGNLSNKDEVINHGDRIAQLVLAKVEKIKFSVTSELSQTVRAEGGIGHTGLA